MSSLLQFIKCSSSEVLTGSRFTSSFKAVPKSISTVAHINAVSSASTNNTVLNPVALTDPGAWATVAKFGTVVLANGGGVDEVIADYVGPVTAPVILFPALATGESLTVTVEVDGDISAVTYNMTADFERLWCGPFWHGGIGYNGDSLGILRAAYLPVTGGVIEEDAYRVGALSLGGYNHYPLILNPIDALWNGSSLYAREQLKITINASGPLTVPEHQSCFIANIPL